MDTFGTAVQQLIIHTNQNQVDLTGWQCHTGRLYGVDEVYFFTSSPSFGR
jgi:hypothetical protein